MIGQSSTIVNVDERAAGRSVKRRMLEQAGYAVIDASSGAETLHAMDEVQPALVLLNLRMPDLKRLDLCRRIKTEYEHVDTMILHISETEILGTEHDMGWDGYLVEPVGQGELLASVRSLLRLRERQRERRGLLEKLRRSEEQFRGLFEQAAVGMCVIGPEGGFLRVNDKLCSIVGRPVDDLMKCELRDLTHPDDRVEHERRVRKLLLGGISEVSLEQRLLRPDGGTVWVTVTLSIQWDAGGRIQSLIGVVEDIEARKQGEVELRNYALRQQLLSEAMDKLLRTDDPSTVIQDIFN
jgi:PAS domain S-box-containing protein